ncbi:hypothetical protein BIW11_08717 [Tropilaelaps mercedesae]|uniref:Uncharacterized protein n=1 Tax=Tropilaelaps mercedesae TaxID=418985 RepID=A0A1V9XND8_9ACAR|nr:hypothetical protein BIW11_08717 [Tropilaelaps mercedesae]
MRNSDPLVWDQRPAEHSATAIEDDRRAAKSYPVIGIAGKTEEICYNLPSVVLSTSDPSTSETAVRPSDAFEAILSRTQRKHRSLATHSRSFDVRDAVAIYRDWA